ncbi:MAG: YmdB family metallophosphoesterase [Clostridiales bacterium]|nr:YmdB family metallophosphoesterase [Clostridiales bacterium]
MRVLFVGDVVAHPGKRILKNKLKAFLSENAVDACIVNAENVAAGLGINYASAKEIFSYGADCITLGNHSFSCPSYLQFAESEPRVIRPGNVSDSWPGQSEYLIDLKEKGRLLVISLMGQVFVTPLSDSPFKFFQNNIDRWKKDYAPTNILIDFHAETTSEKGAMGFFCDGKVSLVLGTHTHVQTADEKILPCGTGYITDVGMTGTDAGILGMDADASLRRLADKLPARYQPAEGTASIQAILADLDEKTGKCLKIERIKLNE